MVASRRTVSEARASVAQARLLPETSCGTPPVMPSSSVFLILYRPKLSVPTISQCVESPASSCRTTFVPGVSPVPSPPGAPP
ncbi:hypothetical protein ADL01_02335 [Streptomyces sp. NRRL WC-3618]|nr:hypothetical protein ADL01_02335 [Streptomyces sp. NRRL WC-3618]